MTGSLHQGLTWGEHLGCSGGLLWRCVGRLVSGSSGVVEACAFNVSVSLQWEYGASVLPPRW